MTHDEQQIANDLDLCDLGLALTRGKTRRLYERQRAACFAEMKRMNAADGLDQMSDDDLLAALIAPVALPPPLRPGMMVIARTFLQPERIARVEQVGGSAVYVTTATAHWQPAVSIRSLTGSLGGAG